MLDKITIVQDENEYKINVQEKTRLFLCKPNRETIAELSEAYGLSTRTNYNGIHELNFKLPFVIEKNKQYIRNDHVDMLRGHFLIRAEKGIQKEYFIISKPRNITHNGIEVKEVKCFLLPYELRDKIIRDEKVLKSFMTSLEQMEF